MSEFDLTTAIQAELTKYSDDVLHDVKDVVKYVVDECKDNIQADSPKDTGDYAKGWAIKKDQDDNLNVSYTIYNKKHYELTHLLENGHATRDGGRVAGIPHIEPNEKKAESELISKIEKAASK